jgi:2-polyprenyl-6-methoxyphenol hydroxylase-like FAD-dependent oxidoreductase
MTQSDVLTIGAGPTGLVLALWLTKLGVKLRILDKTAGPGTTSRALAVQARTPEFYRQLGLADAVVEHGHKVPAANLWVKGEPAARLPFESVGSGLTPYAFLQIFPQDEHERLLIERLEMLGVSVERRTELVSFTDEGERVIARLRGPGGREETCEANYIAGCDGARSIVRETIGTGFPGGTYRQVFYVADVEAAGAAVDGELHVDLDEADFLAVFPLAGEGRARLIGTVRDERADHADTLKFEDVSDRAIKHLKVDVAVRAWNPDRILLLPLYPQYSTTTTSPIHESSVTANVGIGREEDGYFHLRATLEVSVLGATGRRSKRWSALLTSKSAPTLGRLVATWTWRLESSECCGLSHHRSSPPIFSGTATSRFCRLRNAVNPVPKASSPQDF